MPRRMAHVLQVIVLSAGTNALLRRDRPLVVALFVAEEHALELHHPGVRKQERRVVPGNEGGAGDHFMASLGEIV